MDYTGIIDMQIPVAYKVQDYARGITRQDVLTKILSTSSRAYCVVNHKSIVAEMGKVDSPIQLQVDSPNRGIIATWNDQITLMRRQEEYCIVVGAEKSDLTTTTTTRVGWSNTFPCSLRP
eukprot:Gb_32081 [translate_table: standard]